jgi:hypothetical protein
MNSWLSGHEDENTLDSQLCQPAPFAGDFFYKGALEWDKIGAPAKWIRSSSEATKTLTRNQVDE